jgi:hypothetical protein
MRIWLRKYPDGTWSSGVMRPHRSRSVSDATFWDALKGLLVPPAYYVWRFKHKLRNRRSA